MTVMLTSVETNFGHCDTVLMSWLIKYQKSFSVTLCGFCGTFNDDPEVVTALESDLINMTHWQTNAVHV